MLTFTSPVAVPHQQTAIPPVLMESFPRVLPIERGGMGVIAVGDSRSETLRDRINLAPPSPPVGAIAGGRKCSNIPSYSWVKSRGRFAIQCFFFSDLEPEGRRELMEHP